MDGREFLGRGVKFPLDVDERTGKLAMADQEDDIRRAILLILHTSQGERVMRPEYGSTVQDYLFQPDTDAVRQSLAYDIREQLLNQEPRIRDVEVVCRGRSGGLAGLTVEVAYTVRSTNNRYNHVYPFYITEGSEGGGAE